MFSKHTQLMLRLRFHIAAPTSRRFFAADRRPVSLGLSKLSTHRGSEVKMHSGKAGPITEPSWDGPKTMKLDGEKHICMCGQSKVKASSLIELFLRSALVFVCIGKEAQGVFFLVPAVRSLPLQSLAQQRLDIHMLRCIHLFFIELSHVRWEPCRLQ